MKIYTSYFARMKDLRKANILPVSVALWSPAWYVGVKFPSVAPTPFMMGSNCSHERYLAEYDRILSRLNANEIVEQLQKISRGRDVALLCYEKPEDFCHRHLLAEWLNKQGFEVEEFGGKKEERKNEATQLSLFD